MLFNSHLQSMIKNNLESIHFLDTSVLLYSHDRASEPDKQKPLAWAVFFMLVVS